MSNPASQISRSPGERPRTADDVVCVWKMFVGGEISREVAHAWARPWVEDRWSEVDPVVESALQCLHGFDMTSDPLNRYLVRHGGHDEGEDYYHSDEVVRSRLEEFLAGDGPLPPRYARMRARLTLKDWTKNFMTPGARLETMRVFQVEFSYRILLRFGPLGNTCEVPCR